MASKIDLTGQRFGRLAVVGEDGFTYYGKQRIRLWRCICDCGNTVSVAGGRLRSGTTKSCGCLSREIASKNNKIDLSGQRFGRLIVISEGSHTVDGKIRWRCMCDCGATVEVTGNNLRYGITKSCGCLRKESASKINTTHNESHTRLYRVWQGMKERCEKQTHISYQFYGARGITVCKEWQHDYTAFRDWALSHGYNQYALHGECTLDRIDVNGCYSPENCRWVPMSVQNRNRRNSTIT